MLFLLVLALFLLRFPLGKLPLSILALEKRLYLREQNTGQGLHFIEGDSGAVVRKIVSDTCYLMSIRVILTLMDITGILECSQSSDLSIAGGPKSVKVL